MIEVLYFSDKRITAEVRARAQRSARLLVVSATRHGPGMRPVAEREPFATVERELGAQVDQLVCADEGTPEGMWRDPLGALADALYPADGAAAYRAATGYLVLRAGAVLAVVKKGDGPAADALALWRALARLCPALPRAPPGPPAHARRSSARPEPEPPPPVAHRLDPYAVLGVARGTPKSDVRRAFRALVAQYHPDKVAHLAPELQRLAETRTRELTAAWEAIDRGE